MSLRLLSWTETHCLECDRRPPHERWSPYCSARCQRKGIWRVKMLTIGAGVVLLLRALWPLINN